MSKRKIIFEWNIVSKLQQLNINPYKRILIAMILELKYINIKPLRFDYNFNV